MKKLINLYTIGFTKKSAMQFFELLKSNEIDILLDIRLNNKSQLSGFAKGRDLRYFFEKILNCEYIHDDNFAPTKELLENYKKGKLSWEDYIIEYNNICVERDLINYFLKTYNNEKRICLLCSEFTTDNCHRRLLSEKIAESSKKYNIIHL